MCIVNRSGLANNMTVDGIVATPQSVDPAYASMRRGVASSARSSPSTVPCNVITETFDDYAWVTLITDPKSAVSAMVQESRAEGVVAGNYDGELTMEFVGQGAVVKSGDFVITSGVGGGYPPNVVIGRVSGVTKTEQDLFQHVRVDHLASLSGLENVLVLTSFVPQTLERP
jgi:rod shape-determining protein MreC